MEEKRSSLEKAKIAKQAREIYEKFESMCPSKKEKAVSPYQKKVERFEKAALSDLVLVSHYGHAFDGEWVSRDDAQGLQIVDPVEWLNSQVIKRESVRIKRAF